MVIIGDSPLSVMVARFLDRQIARQAHIQVTHLTRDEAFIYWPSTVSLLGQQNFPTKKQLYRYVTLRPGVTKQINLNDHRVITTAGALDYDVLLLDLTPSYSVAELKKISEQCQRLINELKAKINSGHQVKARVSFAGEDASSWQLALALAADLSTFSVGLRRALSVQAQYQPTAALKDFFNTNGVNSGKTVGPLPGLTVAAPTAPLKSRLVRGAALDAKDQFIVRNTLNPEGHPELIVVNGSCRQTQNILRSDQTIANQIASNIERFLEGSRQKEIKLPKPSGLVSGHTSQLSWVGGLNLGGLRSWLVAGLDRKFYRSLFT